MRAPFQVLIILYKKENNNFLYATFYRSSMPIWQFISGGGENDEAPIQTVIRELKEETSVSVTKKDILKLDSMCTIPVVNITGKYTWGEKVYVVPEYSFAIKADNFNIKLSNEHKTFKWLKYNEAMEILKYDSNKTALWELNEKLTKEAV